MASRGLGTLTLDLVLRTGAFEGPLDKAARNTQKRMSDIEKSARSFGRALGVSLAAGFTAVVGGLTLLTKQAIDSADQIRDLSIRLGTSTETISAFGYAASQTGTDIETLGRGMKLLAKNAADALKPTSEQAKIFDALKIKVTDSEGKLRDLGELIPEIADKFKAMEDGTTKAALAQSLFGKSGLELTEFLNQGSQGLEDFSRKAEELGIIIDSKTAAAADEFKDGLGQLKAALGGVGLGIAQQLLPALNEAVKAFSQMAKEGDLANNIASILSATIRAGVGVFDAYTNAVNRVSIAFTFAANAAKGFQEIQKNLGIGGLFSEGSVSGGIEKVKSAIADSQKDLDDLIKRQNSLFKGVSSRVIEGQSSSGGIDLAALQNALSGVGSGSSKKRKSGKSESEKDAESLQKAYESMNERLKEQAALFGVTGEAAKLRYEIESGALKGLDQAKAAELIAGAELIDQLNAEADVKKVLDDLTKEREDATNRGIEATAEQIDQMEFELGLIGLGNKERARQIELRYADAAATDEQRQKIAELSDQMYEAEKSADFFNDTWSSIGDAFVDVGTRSKTALEAIGDVLDDLYKRALQFLADQAIQAFLGGAAGGAGGGASAGSFIDLFSSGASGFGFAGGGYPSANSWSQVNERGPELLSVGGKDYLMMGSQSGRVTPNHMIHGRGVGGNSTTIINVQPTTTRRTADQIAQANERKQRTVTLRNG